MGKRKKRVQKPWCFYCDREFDDEKVLIQHQKAKHFKCHVCHKKLSTAGGMVVHVLQVHKENMNKVPNARVGRESVDIEIFGMEGIPPEALAEHNGEEEEKLVKAAKAEGGSGDLGSLALPQQVQQPPFAGANSFTPTPPPGMVPRPPPSWAVPRMPPPTSLYPAPVPPPGLPTSSQGIATTGVVHHPRPPPPVAIIQPLFPIQGLPPPVGPRPVVPPVAGSPRPLFPIAPPAWNPPSSLPSTQEQQPQDLAGPITAKKDATGSGTFGASGAPIIPPVLGGGSNSYTPESVGGLSAHPPPVTSSKEPSFPPFPAAPISNEVYLVWDDENVSMEERRLSLPKYQELSRRKELMYQEGGSIQQKMY